MGLTGFDGRVGQQQSYGSKRITGRLSWYRGRAQRLFDLTSATAESPSPQKSPKACDLHFLHLCWTAAISDVSSITVLQLLQLPHEEKSQNSIRQKFGWMGKCVLTFTWCCVFQSENVICWLILKTINDRKSVQKSKNHKNNQDRDRSVLVCKQQAPQIQSWVSWLHTDFSLRVHSVWILSALFCTAPLYNICWTWSGPYNGHWWLSEKPMQK